MSIERECSCRDAAWSQGSSPTLLPTKRGRHVVNLKLGIKNSTQAGKARRQLEASIHIGHLKVVVSVTGWQPLLPWRHSMLCEPVLPAARLSRHKEPGRLPWSTVQQGSLVLIAAWCALLMLLRSSPQGEA